MSYSDYISQKGLFKSAYRAERAAASRRANTAHTELFLSIGAAYSKAMPELMMARLFNAVDAAVRVTVNKRKPDFQQSQRLRDAFAKCGGVL